jgi:predicted dehydrogenase
MAKKIASMSDDTHVAMPIRNIISIVAGVAVATWAYSGVIERLNRLETTAAITATEINSNSEFRIKWPRGEMGSLPADSRQDMLIESMQREMESMMEEIEENDAWIDDFRPPEDVQAAVADVREIQIRLRLLEAQLEDFRNNVRVNNP